MRRVEENDGRENIIRLQTRIFEGFREEYGEIARCYVTRSQGENWGRYIAFMSIKDVSTHHCIVKIQKRVEVPRTSPSPKDK